MLLNYCFWSPRGLRASHNKLFVHCVPRPFRRFPILRGAAGSRSFCTVLFSRIERAPFGRNGWVIYQNGPSGARGFHEKNSSFFATTEMPVKRPFSTHEVSLWKPKARGFRPRTGQIRTGGSPSTTLRHLHRHLEELIGGVLVDVPKKAKTFGGKIRRKPNPKGAQASTRDAPIAPQPSSSPCPRSYSCALRRWCSGLATMSPTERRPQSQSPP